MSLLEEKLTVETYELCRLAEKLSYEFKSNRLRTSKEELERLERSLRLIEDMKRSLTQIESDVKNTLLGQG